MNGTHTGRERRMEHGRLNHRMEATSLAWHTGQVRRVGGGFRHPGAQRVGTGCPGSLVTTQQSLSAQTLDVKGEACMEVQALRCIPRYLQEWGKGALTAGVPWMNEVPQSCRGPRPWLLESQRPLEMQ